MAGVTNPGNALVNQQILKAKVKPNYTAKQNQIADWIRLEHNAEIIRSNKKTQCYITTAYDSHWYSFVKLGPINPNARGATDLPDGNFQVFGTKPGGPTTINHSHHCGTIIYSRDRNTKKGAKNNRPINS